MPATTLTTVQAYARTLRDRGLSHDAAEELMLDAIEELEEDDLDAAMTFLDRLYGR